MKLYLAQSVSEEPGILEDKLKTVLTDNVGTGTIFDVNSDDEKKGIWFRYQKDGEDLLLHFAKFDSSSFAYIQGDDIDEDDSFDDRYPVNQNIFVLVYKDYVIYSSMNNLSKNVMSKYFLKQYQIPFNVCFVSDNVLINRIRDIGIKNLSFGDKLSSDEFVNSSQNDPKALAMMDNFAGDELVSLKRTLVLTVKPKRFRRSNLELTSKISEREKEITDKKNHQRTDISGRIVGHIGYTPSYENSEPYTQIPRSEIGRIGRPTLVMLGQIDKISLERRTYKSVTHTQNSGRHEIGNRHFHKNKKHI